MANEIVLINGVTKIELQGSGNYKYLFPLVEIIAYPSQAYYTYKLPNGIELRKIFYTDITDKLGATDIVEYCDALAINNFFVPKGETLNGTTGWGNYRDTVYTIGSPIVVTQGTIINLPNNAGAVIETYLPDGQSLYDGTQIVSLGIGDAYVIRVGFVTRNNNINGKFELELDFGGTLSSFTATFNFQRGVNVPTRYSDTQLYFTLNTFFANGGTLKIESLIGDTTIYNISYVISRIHKAI
jgi:hypothetical protein